MGLAGRVRRGERPDANRLAGARGHATRAGAVLPGPRPPAHPAVLPQLRDHREPLGHGHGIVRRPGAEPPERRAQPVGGPARGHAQVRQHAPHPGARGRPVRAHRPARPRRRDARGRRHRGDPGGALVPDRPEVPPRRAAAHAADHQRPRERAAGGHRARLRAGAGRALHRARGPPRRGPARLGGPGAAVHGAVRPLPGHLRRPGELQRRRRDALVREQRGLGDRHLAALLSPAHRGVHQGRRRHGAAPLRVLPHRDRPGPAERPGGAPRRGADDRRSPRAPAGPGHRAVQRPGDPVGPGERRLLPRGLRPPGRGAAPEAPGRRADLQAVREPAGAA